MCGDAHLEKPEGYNRISCHYTIIQTVQTGGRHKTYSKKSFQQIKAFSYSKSVHGRDWKRKLMYLKEGTETKFSSCNSSLFVFYIALEISSFTNSTGKCTNF